MRDDRPDAGPHGLVLIELLVITLILSILFGITWMAVSAMHGG